MEALIARLRSMKRRGLGCFGGGDGRLKEERGGREGGVSASSSWTQESLGRTTEAADDGAGSSSLSEILMTSFPW